MLFAFALIPQLALAAVVSALPTNLHARVSSNCTLPAAEYCQGTNYTSSQYLCGDARLGPVDLPRQLPLGTLFAEYDRLGGLCPGAFLEKWTNRSTGAYVYPPVAGFQLNTVNAPIQGNQTLAVGARLDRFGSAYGSYLAPAFAPYAQRALPPSSLDTPPGGAYPDNYHMYEVLQEFVVLSGPIAPWFGQPGQGTQYATHMSVGALVNASYLRELERDEY